MMKKKKTFVVDNQTYTATVDDDGMVSFEPLIIPAKTKKDKYDLFWKDNKYKDFDIVKNAIPVFNIMADFVVDYVFTENPPYMYFKATTPRKAKIYEWLAKKLLEKLKTRYTMYEHPKGQFNFYRLEIEH